MWYVTGATITAARTKYTAIYNSKIGENLTHKTSIQLCLLKLSANNKCQQLSTLATNAVNVVENQSVCNILHVGLDSRVDYAAGMVWEVSMDVSIPVTCVGIRCCKANQTAAILHEGESYNLLGVMFNFNGKVSSTQNTGFLWTRLHPTVWHLNVSHSNLGHPLSSLALPVWTKTIAITFSGREVKPCFLSFLFF